MSSKCFSTSCGEMRHEPRLRTTSVAIGYSQREELSHQHTICSVLGIPRGRPSWRRKSRLLKFLVSIPFFLRFFRVSCYAHIESRYDRLFLLFLLNAFVMNRPSFSWW